MLPVVTSYTVPTNIVDGPTNFIEGADVNQFFTGSNQVNDSLTKLTNNIQATITTTTTLTQNQSTNNLVNSTGGAFTITLPTGLGSYKPYTFLKISNDYNPITISRASSDTIDNPFSPTAAPTDTSIKLIVPGDSCTVFWDGTYWRVVYNPNNKVAFYASLGTTVSPTATVRTKLSINTEKYDYGGYYDSTTNYRYTPLIKGIYQINVYIRFSATNLNAFIYNSISKNGSDLIRTLQGGSTIFTDGPTFLNAQIEMNGTTDYLEVFVLIPNGGYTGSILGESTLATDASYWTGKLVQRT